MRRLSRDNHELCTEYEYPLHSDSFYVYCLARPIPSLLAGHNLSKEIEHISRTVTGEGQDQPAYQHRAHARRRSQKGNPNRSMVIEAEGKLGGQAAFMGTISIWEDPTDSINLMAANLTAQMRDIADATSAVARLGALPFCKIILRLYSLRGKLAN